MLRSNYQFAISIGFVAALWLTSHTCDAAELTSAGRAAAAASAAAPKAATEKDLQDFLRDRCRGNQETQVDIKKFGKAEELICTGDSNDLCVSTVIVELAESGCTARWQYDRYRVAKDAHPRLVWTLDDRTSTESKKKYRFANADSEGIDGIAMCPASQNSWQADLAEGRCSDKENCQSYEWKAINKRPRLRYDGRPPHHGKPSSGHAAAIHFGIIVMDDAGNRCDFTDPIIITSGN